MRTTLAFALCILACRASLGDSARAGNPPARANAPMPDARQGSQSMIGQLSSTVVFLYSPAGDALGTAFIVGYPMAQSSDRMIPLVVTAKHVIAAQNQVFAKFKTKSGSNAKTVTFAYDLTALRTSGDYWEDADPDVDIVVFRTTVQADADFVSIPIELIASKKTYSDEDLKETDHIVFPSMLVGLQGLSRDYPVVRDGSIALIPDEGIPLDPKNPASKRVEAVLINAAANQGSSGAPVFLWSGARIKHGSFTVGGDKPLLLGLIKGFFRALPREVVGFDIVAKKDVPIGLATNTSPPHPIALIYSEDSRIGMCTPSWLLLQILHSASLKARMKTLGATE